MDNSTIIITSSDELRNIIASEIRLQLASLKKEEPPILKDRLSHKEAAAYLCELGYKTTPGSLYILVHKRNIPFRKIRNNTVFSRKELARWVEEQITIPHDPIEECSAHIRRSALKRD